MKHPDNESDVTLRLVNELDHESDRALAIVTSAHLEDLLERLLSKTLNTLPPEAQEFLFQGANAPLGAFHTKIEVIKRSKLLSDEEVRDLDLIRKIRNEFAHKLIGISFETTGVRDRCAELRSAQIGGDPGTPRERFKKATIRLIVDIAIKVQGTPEEHP
ncbi:MAG: hypothetical protein AB1512_24415 [Thermodesulfobacteriota bacterium]